MITLAVLLGLAIVGLVLTNILWLRHFRYLTNLAVAKSPIEFATIQAASNPTIKDSDRPKRVRPEGI